MICPVCNTNNPPGEAFCENCGAALNQAAPNAPQTSSPPIATYMNTGNTSTTINAGVVTGGGPGGAPRTLSRGASLQNGRYVIDKVLGQGGMGAALLAHDTRISNKQVVVKELTSDSTDPKQKSEDQQNFEREVETLAKIDHPFVPRVTDYFQEGSHSFMVQDYVAGQTLEDRMSNAKAPMPEREALGYMSQLLDVLDYLEKQTPPIVHRDIKPANVIISSRDNKAHLVDFGIARAEAARKQTSALGTPGYAPPEQYQGRADTRSDLYALAATIHYLVTNHDPANDPMFDHPSARSLNPKVSKELDTLLTKALTINAAGRYQSAAEMKRAVDNILTPPTRPAQAAPQSRPQQQARNTNPVPVPPVSPVTPIQQPTPIRSYPAQQAPNSSYGSPSYQNQKVNNANRVQAGTFAPQSKPPRRGGLNPFVFSFILLLLVVVVIGAAIFVLPNLNKKSSTTGAQPTTTTISHVTPTAPPFTPPTSGIGVTTVGSDTIGISDGTAAFDTNRKDGTFKQQAATNVASNRVQAESLLRQAISTEPNDAEAQIYLANLRVLDSGKPYITVVVATMLSQDNIGVGRDDLQGAYIAQMEYNAASTYKLNGGTQVRLLIASSGSQAVYAKLVAEQIVQLAKSDKTFVGVMGWPFSTRTENATSVLQAASIPMVSQTSSDDSLTGSSPYFFRVAPPNKQEAIVGANYATNTLHAKTAVLFADFSDSYSQSLAADFQQQFQTNGGKILATEQYKVNSPTKPDLASLLQDALSKNPDIIYYSGYAADINTLLENYPSSANVPILGGDALYQLGGYSANAKVGFTHLKFTAFFYPDVWGILRITSPQPFSDYASVYGAGGGTGYGFTRIDGDAALSYDATAAILNGYNKAASSSGGTITPDQLKTGLTKVSFQGISGHIAFDSNGDPVSKAIYLLNVSQQGTIGLVLPLFGKFTA